MMEPVPASFMGFTDCPDAEEDAGQVDVEDPLPLGQRVVLDGPDVDDPGVVDQHVQAAEFADRGGYRRLPIVRLGDVEVNISNTVAELLGDHLALVVEDVAGHDFRALRHHHPHV